MTRGASSRSRTAALGLRAHTSGAAVFTVGDLTIVRRGEDIIMLGGEPEPFGERTHAAVTALAVALHLAGVRIGEALARAADELRAVAETIRLLVIPGPVAAGAGITPRQPAAGPDPPTRRALASLTVAPAAPPAAACAAA